jgi:hypothetical protein
VRVASKVCPIEVAIKALKPVSQRGRLRRSRNDGSANSPCQTDRRPHFTISNVKRVIGVWRARVPRIHGTRHFLRTSDWTQIALLPSSSVFVRKAKEWAAWSNPFEVSKFRFVNVAPPRQL